MARVARSEEERLIIAYNIRRLRVENYPSSGKCAEAFGVPHSQWSPWESAKRTPDPERLDKLAAFFKCTAKDMLTPPENWKEEKARFIKERAESRKTRKENIAIQEESVSEPKVDRDDGASDYISIVTMLAKVQSRYDKGEIPKELFNAKMQVIRELVSFAYSGLMNEKH